VTIGLFIVESSVGTTMVEQMKDFLSSFELLNKVIAFVKYVDTNLGMLTTTLKSIISCNLLDLPTPFFWMCGGHAISKVA
jgi:hypothetical protein